MSDTDKTDPAAPAPAAQPVQPAQPAAPARPQEPPISRQRFERPGRREPGPKKVQPIEPERDFAAKPSLRDLDKELEAEMEAALTGFSGQELVGEQPKGPAPAPSGPKKGRVLAVHGADVFVDVPGGRGQGVMPLTQFPEGPPAP